MVEQVFKMVVFRPDSDRKRIQHVRQAKKQDNTVL